MPFLALNPRILKYRQVVDEGWRCLLLHAGLLSCSEQYGEETATACPKLLTWGSSYSFSAIALMTRACSTEEPCAAKVACTVLETSGGSDLLAEFNRSLRRAVLWRRRSFGTQSAAGGPFGERRLTNVTSVRQQRRHVLDYLTAACTAAICKSPALSLLPLTSPPLLAR